MIRLPYRVPFNWPAMLDFLRPRATPGVELVEEDSYRRTIRVGDAAGTIDVRPDAVDPVLLIGIDLPTSDGLIQVVDRVRRMFDLGADSRHIDSHLSGDQALRQLLLMRPGLRVSGAWDGFEVSVRAILGEGLLAAGPRLTVRRLVRTFGRPIASSFERLTHLFPQPEVLADADLSTAGIRGRKAGAVRALARAVCARELTFEVSRPLEEAVAALQTICGAGESAAHYIAMRAFGEPDAFPCVDPGSVHGGPDGVAPSPAAIRQRAERWRPWRAYGAMHLWAARAARDV